MKKIDLSIEDIENMINDISFKKNLQNKKEELEICESILIKLQNAIYEQG